MTDLLAALRGRMLLGDGAMGTELQARGLEVGECLELWNVEHADVVESIHRDYVEAGADLVLTNSFGATSFKLSKFGFEGRVGELNEAAARVARAAAGAERIVLGDVGPTGELMAPLGLHDADAFEAAFAKQIEALVRGGVDGIILETMTAIEEVEAAVKAARSVTDMPVLTSMQFKRDADGVSLHTMMGVDVPSYAKRALEWGVEVVGGNCSTPEELLDVVRLLKETVEVPVFAEPNAGVPELIGGKTVFKLGPVEYADAVAGLVEAGVSLLGGCCGTTPEHIRVLAERLGREA